MSHFLAVSLFILQHGQAGGQGDLCHPPLCDAKMFSCCWENLQSLLIITHCSTH